MRYAAMDQTTFWSPRHSAFSASRDAASVIAGLDPAIHLFRKKPSYEE
jgi:hypothetical protein